MGLDIVELAMALEETFGIEIADSELENVLTAGDLADVVASKLIPLRSPAQGCLTLEAFLRLRRALVESTGIPKSALRLDACMAELLPLEHRPEKWADLQRRSGLFLPPLAPTRTYRRWDMLCVGMCALSAALCVAGGIAFAIGRGGMGESLGTLGASLWLAVLLVASLHQRLRVQARTMIPGETGTFGGLLCQVVKLNAARLNLPPARFTSEQIWSITTACLEKQTGASAADIRRSSRIYQDLGLGD